MESLFDFLVIVISSEKNRLERLLQRGVSEDQAKARMAKQVDDQARKAAADFLIVNDGNLYLFADAGKYYSLGDGSADNILGTLTIKNIISGSGQLNIDGPGIVSIANDSSPGLYSDGILFNTYSGGTNITSNGTLFAFSNNALGSGPINSSNGNFGTFTDVVMPRLTVNGQINLLSDVRSTGDQVYNGAVVVPSFNNSTTIESLTGDEKVKHMGEVLKNFNQGEIKDAIGNNGFTKKVNPIPKGML
jgi:hypothetical protein